MYVSVPTEKVSGRDILLWMEQCKKVKIKNKYRDQIKMSVKINKKSWHFFTLEKSIVFCNQLIF